MSGQWGSYNLISLNSLKDIDNELTYDNMDFIHSQHDAVQKNVIEQMIKDVCFRLVKLKKIRKLDLNIYLHSHGIDEYWPPKTAKDIVKRFRTKKLTMGQIRTSRCRTGALIVRTIINTRKADLLK